MNNILNCTGYELYSPTILYGKGCNIYDKDGREIVDFDSGVWSLSLGHCNKRINDRMIQQIQNITHTGYRYAHPVVKEAADKLLRIMGMSNGKCVFLSSGSEAVEFCIRLVNNITDKPKILTLKDHYLSAYGLSGDYLKSEQCINIDWQCMNYRYESEDWAKILDQIPFHQISAFVFEPGNASGTVKLPPKGLINGIVERIHDNNSYIIIDEVTTGIGRTGKWFGFENYDIQPDMIACGKGIGNGYPVSAIGLSETVWEKLSDDNFRYAQSHQNDPLGCAVICEVLSIIEEENILEHVIKMGKYLKSELINLSKELSIIKEVRGIGLMCAIDLEDSYDENTLKEIHKELYKKGVLVGLKTITSTIRFYPPLIVEQKSVEKLIGSLKDVLSGYIS